MGNRQKPEKSTATCSCGCFFLALFYRESDFAASQITDLECLHKCSETKISQDQAYVTHFPRIFVHYNASQVLHIECLIHAHVFMCEACPQN